MSSESIKSNAISMDMLDNTKRWDKSILYSRVAIIILVYSALLSWRTLYIGALDSGIAIYGGLFHITSISQIFQIFIFILSAAILQLTAFYPRKVWVEEHSTLKNFLFKWFIYSRRQINGEQFKLIEYPLILLFTVTGVIFLQFSSHIFSIFFSWLIISYALYILSTISLDISSFFNKYIHPKIIFSNSIVLLFSGFILYKYNNIIKDIFSLEDILLFIFFVVVEIVYTPHILEKVISKSMKIIKRFKEKGFLLDLFFKWLSICLTRYALINIFTFFHLLFPSYFIDFNFLATSILTITVFKVLFPNFYDLIYIFNNFDLEKFNLKFNYLYIKSQKLYYFLFDNLWWSYIIDYLEYCEIKGLLKKYTIGPLTWIYMKLEFNLYRPKHLKSYCFINKDAKPIKIKASIFENLFGLKRGYPIGIKVNWVEYTNSSFKDTEVNSIKVKLSDKSLKIYNLAFSSLSLENKILLQSSKNGYMAVNILNAAYLNLQRPGLSFIFDISLINKELSSFKYNLIANRNKELSSSLYKWINNLDKAQLFPIYKKAISCNNNYINSIIANYNKNLTVFMDIGSSSSSSNVNYPSNQGSHGYSPLINEVANAIAQINSLRSNINIEEVTIENYNRNIHLLKNMAEISKELYIKLNDYLINKNYSLQEIQAAQEFNTKERRKHEWRIPIFRNMAVLKDKLIRINITNNSLEDSNQYNWSYYNDYSNMLNHRIKRSEIASLDNSAIGDRSDILAITRAAQAGSIERELSIDLLDWLCDEYANINSDISIFLYSYMDIIKEKLYIGQEYNNNIAGVDGYLLRDDNSFLDISLTELSRQITEHYVAKGIFFLFNTQDYKTQLEEYKLSLLRDYLNHISDVLSELNELRASKGLTPLNHIPKSIEELNDVTSMVNS
jgi:hypothetical protein